jgi:RES domain-containing protein
VVGIQIPDEVTLETVSIDQLKDWDAENMMVSRSFGDEWIRTLRTAVLRVPSVITQGREHNLVLNTAHPQFALIRAGSPEPVKWDSRLFRSGK